MAQALFREIQRRSAAEAVCDQLVELVESGELAVGERLPPEKELARSFGVSRPVVREALERLRTLGFVVSRSGSGSFVASRTGRGPLLLGRYSARDLHDVRALLEVPGAGIAAVRRSAVQLDELSSTIESLDRCSEPEDWVRLDAVFHVQLAEATDNAVHAHIVANLRDLLVHQSRVVAPVPGRIARANDEHRAIFEAVGAGERATAEQAMAEHLARGRAVWETFE